MSMVCDAVGKPPRKGRGPARLVKTVAATRVRVCKGCGVVQDVYKHSKSQQCLECRDKARRNDISGNTYGQLTVVSFSGKGRWGPEWNCRCSCGILVTVFANNLTGGNSTSCGCKGAFEDLTGQEFGLLTVMEWNCLNASAAHLWVCSCMCGGTVLVQTNNLRSGNTRSCGCLTGMKFPRVLTGLTFGWLTVVSPADTRKNGINWNCKCKCGANIVVYGGKLRLWQKVSCGCAQTGSHVPIRPAAVRQAIRRAIMPRRNNHVKGERFTWPEVKALYERQKGKCAEPTCRIKLNWVFHRDHIISVKLGGPNLITNIQLLCGPCNRRKGSLHPIDWARKNGRLL